MQLFWLFFTAFRPFDFVKEIQILESKDFNLIPFALSLFYLSIPELEKLLHSMVANLAIKSLHRNWTEDTLEFLGRAEARTSPASLRSCRNTRCVAPSSSSRLSGTRNAMRTSTGVTMESR